jgi:hypothetical protein
MASLRLVDDDGNVVYKMGTMDVKSLSGELFYTIDYRPEQYPEYAALKNALDRWLSALS